VTGGDDQTVLVRNAADLKTVAVLRGQQGVIHALAFSPHGRWLASAARSRKVILWEVGTWKKIREMVATQDIGGGLIFTSDNQHLMLGHRQMWDVQTGRDLSASIPTGIWGPAALAHDGSEWVSIDGAGEVSFRRLRDYRLLHQQPVHRLNGRAAAYSHDGKLVVTGADDVVFWDAQTHRVLTHLEYADNVWSLAFSPDDRWLVAGYGDGAIIVWDAVERRRVADFGGHTAKVRNVGFLPDGQKFFSASEDNSVILWDAATGAKETVFQWDTFSLSHSTLFDQGRQLFIYDYQSRKSLIYHLVERRAAEFQVAPIDTALTMVPHRQQILSGHGVYDATDGQRLVDFRARGQLIFAGYIFSADEQWLVNPEEKSLQVWNTTTWEVTEQAELTEVMPIRLALSADGKQLAVGGSAGEVLLWRLHPLRQVAVLGRHKNHVQSLAFSPDGTRLASAGDDNTIKLWNLTTRRLMSDIGMHTAPILSVAFSPDGKQLISGEHDRSVRVYTRQQRLWGWELDN
jgi:WD40 repeat protein